MIRAVIFDLDDTLIDWTEREGDWTVHNREFLRPIHEHLTALGHVMPSIDWMVQTYGDQARIEWEKAYPPEWRCPRQIDILRNTLHALNLDINKLDIDALQRLYGWKAHPGVRVFDDTLDVLQSLKRAGIKLGLLTNADLPMWMRDKELETFEILQYMDIRVTAGDIGRLKPHPEPFNEVMRRLDVQPEESVFVGDRLQDDVVGARTAGMRAVWIRRSTSQWIEPADGIDGLKPNATVYRLSQLLETFDVWYPGWRKSESKEGLGSRVESSTL